MHRLAYPAFRAGLGETSPRASSTCPLFAPRWCISYASRQTSLLGWFRSQSTLFCQTMVAQCLTRQALSLIDQNESWVGCSSCSAPCTMRSWRLYYLGFLRRFFRLAASCSWYKLTPSLWLERVSFETFCTDLPVVLYVLDQIRLRYCRQWFVPQPNQAV